MKDLMKKICDHYQVNIKDAKCLVKKKRKVVYILRYGSISSLECFHKPPKGESQIVLIPDGFTVAFQALNHIWIGQVSYLTKKQAQVYMPSVASMEDSHSDSNRIPFYKVYPINEQALVQVGFQSEFCDNPTRAFKQAYGRLHGPIPKNRRPNGRLLLGLYYLNTQIKLSGYFIPITPGVLENGDDATDLITQWSNALQNSQSEFVRLGNQESDSDKESQLSGMKRPHDLMKENSSNSVWTVASEGSLVDDDGDSLIIQADDLEMDHGAINEHDELLFEEFLCSGNDTFVNSQKQVQKVCPKIIFDDD